HNLAGQAWRVGIQHPRADGVMVETLELSNTAVCTSGDYERLGHIVDARTRGSLALPLAQQPSAAQQSAATRAPDLGTTRQATATHAIAAQGTATQAIAAEPISTRGREEGGTQQRHAAQVRGELASVTVLAPTAMAADGLSTAAMVLGRDRGIRLLEHQPVRRVLVAPAGTL